MNFVAFLLALGSALRLTRLAVTDTITQPFRSALAFHYSVAADEAAVARSNAKHLSTETNYKALDRRYGRALRVERAWLFLVQLFECPWCIGFWISMAAAGVAVSPAASWTVTLVAAAGLSLSWLVGALAFLEATVEDVHHRLD